MKKIVLLTFFSAMALFGSAQDTIIPLWPKGLMPNYIASDERETQERANGMLKLRKVQEPTIEVYLPAKGNATGEGLLIFPGGGYGILAYDWEGTDIAKFLNGKGIAGIVVKYRLPSDRSQKEKHHVPLIDAQRALRSVRSMAGEFNLDADKIGIIGFSAGGHLAATLGTQFNENVYAPIDAIDTESARPDFMALCYPVIAFGETVTHKGSQNNLLGKDAAADLIKRFSAEKQVTTETPPTFLVHALDDVAVPVANSLLFLEALEAKGCSATLHVYPKGGHGFSLARDDRHLRGWTERMVEWISSLE